MGQTRKVEGRGGSKTPGHPQQPSTSLRHWQALPVTVTQRLKQTPDALPWTTSSESVATQAHWARLER
eukprot:1959068-Rhodomonas_salina.1